MKTDDLIAKLSSEIKPVSPWATPGKMAFRYLLIATVLLAVGLLLTGTRYDFSAKSLQMNFWLGVVLWSTFCFLGLSVVFRLATPGQKISRNLGALFFLNLGGLCLWHLLRLLGMNSVGILQGLELAGVRCASVTALAAMILGSIVFYRAKQGASRRPHISSLLIGLSGLAMGGVLISLNCGDDNGMHVLMWHFLIPGIITLGLAAAWMGKLLRW